MATKSAYKRQITGTSDVSVDDAIGRALSVARETYGEPDWFDVGAARGFISNGRVTHYQVTLELGDEPGSSARSESGYFHAACARSMSSPSQRTVDIRL